MAQYILDLSPEDRNLMLAAHRAAADATSIRDELMVGFVNRVLPAPERGDDIVNVELSVEANGDVRLTEREAV